MENVEKIFYDLKIQMIKQIIDSNDDTVFVTPDNKNDYELGKIF